MDKVTNVLVGTDLLLVVWDWSVLWLVLIDPLSPDLVISGDSVWKLLEEEGVVVVELVLRQRLQVQPSLLFHPVEWLAPVIDTGTGLQEKTDIGWGQSVVLDEDLRGHHQLEGNFISLEQTSIDVSIYFPGQPASNIDYSVFNHLSLW